MIAMGFYVQDILPAHKNNPLSAFCGIWSPSFHIIHFYNLHVKKNIGSPAPQKAKDLLREFEKLTASQIDHVMLIVKDIVGEK